MNLKPKTNLFNIESAIVKEALKYTDSREECRRELAQARIELEANEQNIATQKEKIRQDTIHKFEQDYDEQSNAIIAKIKENLNLSKERAIEKIMKAKTDETVEEKHIKGDIQALLLKITDHQEGLKSDVQYREYISKIVLTDYEGKRKDINERIARMNRSPFIVSVDRKLEECMYRDASSVLYIVEKVEEKQKQDLNMKVNSHTNRDQIKKGL